MAERRDSSDSRSESSDSDTTRTILSISSCEYIDPEGGATIEPYQFEPENEADGQDSASTGDDDDDHENNLRLGNTHCTFFTTMVYINYITLQIRRLL